MQRMAMSKSLESQRKSPRQSRSKALVEAIYEATVRILPKVGSGNITTKKIAEMAGVSVGSLYQYFPNKESVLGAVMDMALKSHVEEAQKKIAELNGKSAEEAIAMMIDFALNAFLTEREKVREIFKKAPELGRIPVLLKFRQQFVESLAEEFKRHAPGHSQEEYVRASFIAVNSV